MANLRRLAEGIEPYEIIDLTVDGKKEEPEEPEETKEPEGPIYTCPICFEPYKDPVATMCGHVFCKGCLSEWLRTIPRCPVCNQHIWNYIQLFMR